MNVLFLTLVNIYDINEHNIYTDLLREFAKRDHKVFILSPTERRNKEKTKKIKLPNCTILKPRIGNIQKANLIEKGITTITLERKIKKAIKEHFFNVKFDLVLYSTPPITMTNAIKYIKKRDRAKTYLLLKDIFPQNSVDLGLLNTSGLKSLIYRYFRKKEKKLYALSDRIGCMSPANVDYILKHNPEIRPEIVEVCPNCIDIVDKSITFEDRITLRNKYEIPLSKKVFVYGGNLGKPQGIPFIIKCLSACREITDAFFFIVGDGTEYGKLEEFIEAEKPCNVKLLKSLPKDEYDSLVAACDVGLIFLDFRFTIPNFPSRLLSYMQAGLPILAATDTSTDIGKIITEGGFGWWCQSDRTDAFCEKVREVCNLDCSQFGKNGLKFLSMNYSSEVCFNIITRQKGE